MPLLPFYKYQGAGNDFVVVDNRGPIYLPEPGPELVRRLCHRRFGVGADGLMLLQNKEGFDFEMIYFNADGKEGSMCGNGGRCIVAFARRLGLIKNRCRFLAIDGPHEAIIERQNWVELKMGNVSGIEIGENYYYLDTGSPHYVTFVDDVARVDVVQEGRAVRYSDRFEGEGTNVNFVQLTSGGISVATYERGVEDETLACGTGVTASAIAYYLRKPGKSRQEVAIRAKGGQLLVRFRPADGGFEEIWLCGPAALVFEGEIEI